MLVATNLAKEFGDGSQMALRAADARDQDKSSEGFAGELLHSAAYSALQQPVSGIAQLFGGKALKDATTFIEKPKEATNLADWHAQQIGGALGMVAPFALMNFGVHKGMDKLLALRGGTQTAETLGMMSMGRAVAESTIAGGLYEGLLTPSGDNESLAGGRFRNFLHGAATFGTLTAGARALNDFGVMKNRIGIGVLSGLPAGFVSAESDSLLHGQGLAKADDVAKNMYTFAMAGGVLSAIHSIPFGDRGAKGDKANAETLQAEAPRANSVEFRIANEQSRAALEAFRSGQKPIAFAEVLKAGEPKRLLVTHDGNVPFELGTRADFVASCNLPEVSPFARKIAVDGAHDKPMYMDLGKDTVRISTERTSPESVELGPKENMAKMRMMLRDRGVEPDSLPKWAGQFKPTGKIWAGDNATVLELESPRESFPDVVLKIKRGDFEGQRDWEADIYNHRGEVDANAVHETTNLHIEEEPLYIFLEDRVDYNHPDTNGYQELMDLLASRGLQISDPGSGPPVGRSRNSGRWVVADRDAVSKIGSGEHEVERAFAMGGDEFEQQRELEEESSGDRFDDGWGEFDGNDEAAKERALSALKLNPRELGEAQKLFGVDNPDAAIKSLIEQMTDGLSSKEDVHIMQQYAFANGDGKAAKSQIAFVARLLTGQGIRANDWVK